MGFLNEESWRLTRTKTMKRQRPSIYVYLWIGLLFTVPTFPEILSTQQQSFRKRPEDRKVRLGYSIILPCEIENQAGQAQWTKDGFALGFDKEIPGFSGRYSMSGDARFGVHNLVIVNVSLQDIAEFQCQVGPYNGTKAIRSNAILDVVVPPKSIHITNYSSDSTLTLKEKQETELECIVSDSRPPASIFWYRNGVLFNSGAAAKVKTVEDSDGLYTKISKIKFITIDGDDFSTFTCEARHSELDRPMRANVNYRILYPPAAPRIHGYIEGDLLREGQSVTLICKSHGGNPLAKLVWYKNDEWVESVDKTQEHDRNSRRELTFYATAEDNLARFRCEAMNSMSVAPKIADVVVTVLFPPKQVEISGVKEAKIGENVTLSCRTSVSNPKTAISWFKGGGHLDDLYTSISESVSGGWVTTSNITVKMDRKESFTCQAQAVGLSVTTSRGILVSVLEPPGQPIIHTETVNITAGQTHGISCTSTGGHPPASLAWYKENEEGGRRKVVSINSLEGNTAKADLFLTVNASDNGFPYVCEAINKALSAPLSSEVIFSVIFPPSAVTIKHNPAQLREGQKAYLSCESGSSNPPAEVSLYKNLQLVSSHLNQSVRPGTYGGSETSISLELDLTSASHGVTYTCQARNSAGRGQDSVTLDVNYKPQINSNRKMTGVEGDSAVISLIATANPSAINYTWTMNGSELKTTSNVLVEGPILNFTQLNRTHIGLYQVEARNDEGSTVIPVELDVKYSPSIIESSSEVVAEQGEDATLECVIDANPLDESMIQWESADSNKIHHKRRSEGEKFYLTIENVTIENAGEYFCIVDNRIGAPVNASVFLMVNHKPQLDRSPEIAKSASTMNATGKLICRATGVPRVTFFWSRNEVAIAKDKDPSKYAIHNRSPNPMTFESTLEIYKVDQFDYDDYKCIAKNEIGTSERYITFDKPSPPDMPTDVRIENTTEASVTLTWVAGFDGGYKQSFVMEYFQVRSPQKRLINTNITTITVGSLTPGTQYYFSVKAINSIGESNWTKELMQGTVVVRSVTSTMDYHANFSRLIVTTFIIVGSIVLVVNLILIGCFVRHRTKKREDNRLNTKSPPVEMYATSSYNGTGESSLSEKSYCGENELVADKSRGISTYFVDPTTGDRIALPSHHHEDDSLRRSGYRVDDDNSSPINNPPMYGSTFRPSHPDICPTSYYPSPSNSSSAINGNMHTPNPNPIDQSFLNWRINATLSPALSTFASPNIENEGHLV